MCEDFQQLVMEFMRDKNRFERQMNTMFASCYYEFAHPKDAAASKKKGKNFRENILPGLFGEIAKRINDGEQYVDTFKWLKSIDKNADIVDLSNAYEKIDKQRNFDWDKLSQDFLRGKASRAAETMDDFKEYLEERDEISVKRNLPIFYKEIDRRLKNGESSSKIHESLKSVSEGKVDSDILEEAVDLVRKHPNFNWQTTFQQYLQSKKVPRSRYSLR